MSDWMSDSPGCQTWLDVLRLDVRKVSLKQLTCFFFVKLDGLSGPMCSDDHYLKEDRGLIAFGYHWSPLD